MARLPRLYAPHMPQLVQAQFAQTLAAMSDPTPAAVLDQLLAWLHQDAQQNQVAVHGWLLLNDRVTLLATPPDAHSIPRLVQALGRRMAAGMHHGRVFSGRYRSALIQPGLWVLPALVWLESLPVKLEYVDRAQVWPWSSAAAHIGEAARGSANKGDLVIDHTDYWGGGNTPFARQASYRERLEQGLSSVQSQRIEQALVGQWALGEPKFLSALATHATRRIVPAARGRPKKISA